MSRTRREYIAEVFGQEPRELAAIRAAMTEPDDQISVPPEDGRLLQLLVSLSGAKKIVEIGTLGGYSSTWMAQALPADGVIYTLEYEDRRADIAQAHFQKYAPGKNIQIIRGRALDTLPGLSAKGPFDLVFIDADKVSYAKYLDWAEANVRSGGLIIGDNTFLFDAVLDERTGDRVRETALAAMLDFNRRLANPDKYLAMMFNTGQGMTIARKL
ncbi:MAG TPA: O-methyltransferase [Patescibacteria group bacterium]|nr:O-methyltransferase [Patescibacteria group bacterium]